MRNNPRLETRKSTKRRLNVRLLFWLAVPTMLLGFGIFQLHSVQVRRKTGALVVQADRAEARGDLRKAEENLRLYLGYEPNNPVALAKYGLILTKKAKSVDDRIRALQALEMAILGDPSRRDIRRQCADIALSLSRFDTARRHLQILLGKEKPGGVTLASEFTLERGELENLVGRCCEGESDYTNASLWYGDAIAHSPHEFDSYVRLADLLRNRLDAANGADRVMDAREVKDGLIAANPQSFRAYLERCQYRKKYKIDGADQDLARALELAPNESDVLLSAALFAIDRGDFDAARRHLTAGLKHHPQNWQTTATLAWVERRTGHPDVAEASLRQGLDAAADPQAGPQLLWILADVLLDEGKWAEAGKAIEQLRGGTIRREMLSYLEARLRVGEGNWIEASKTLETIQTRLMGEAELAQKANLLLGLCYEQLGDLDRRYAAFRRVIAIDPQGVVGHLGFAAALEAMGRLDEAVREYRRVIDRAPSAGTPLARLLILGNLRSPAAQRDWVEVEQILKKTDQANPGSTEVTILRAEVLLAQGQPDRARDLLVKARDVRPDRIEFWIALAELAGRQETPEAALSILKEAERRLGERVELRLALANHWSKRSGAEVPKALAELEPGLAILTAGDQERLLRALADAHLRISDPVGADRLLSQLIRLRPFDVSLRFAQFAIALQLGDQGAMERYLNDLEAMDPDLVTSTETVSAFWRCAKARFLWWLASRESRLAVKVQQLDEARQLLIKAGSLRPSWSLVPFSEAEIEELAGNTQRALKGYLRAVELGMHSPDVIRRAVQLLFDRGRYDQADEMIHKLQESDLGSSDPLIQRLAAEVSLKLNDRTRALELARNSIPAESKNYRDHLWLGQIFWIAGQQSKAAEELRRAVALAGGEPAAWMVLVQYLVRTGQHAEAKALVERARERLSGEQAPLALACCYAEIGDRERAGAQFHMVLASRPDDVAALRAAANFALSSGQGQEAETLLRRILDPTSKSLDDQTWARRLLAIVLASSGDQQKSREAMKLMDIVDEGAAYQPQDGEPVDELRAKAKVLSVRKNRTARRAAIRVLLQITEQDSHTPDDRYLLTQLYEAEGDWSKAHKQILSLLAEGGENSLYLAHAISNLLRRGATDEATSYLERLEKLEPKAFRTLALKSRVLTAKGQAGAATALLKSAAQDNTGQVGNVAVLLEEQGQDLAAEELYRKFVTQSRQPEATLILAAFLGRRHRVSEALDLCEKAWKFCPPEAVAQAIVAILYSAPIDEAQCRDAARSLQRELKKAPTSAALLFHLANVGCLHGDYQEAETLYRQSIAHDKSNSGPLANLAWLLARRDRKGAEALELVAQAMYLDGPASDLLDTRAVAYLTMGRSDLAIKDLEDAVSVQSSPIKSVHLAQAYLMANMRDRAIAALESAKAAGFRADTLSPLEREPCQRLLDELARK